MVRSIAFTEKTDGEETPKGPYPCEAALNAEGFERAKHFEPLRSSITHAKHLEGVRGV